MDLLQLILVSAAAEPNEGTTTTPLVAVIGVVGVVLGALITVSAAWLRDGRRVQHDRRARHEDQVAEAVSELVAIGSNAAKSAASMREAQRTYVFLTDGIRKNRMQDWPDWQSVEEDSQFAEETETRRRVSLQELFGHMDKLRPLQFRLRILAPSLNRQVGRFIETVGNATHSAPHSDDPEAITSADVDAVTDALIREAQQYLAVPVHDHDLVLDDPTHAAPLDHGNSSAAWTMVLLIIAGAVNVMSGMLSAITGVIIAGIFLAATGVAAGIIMGKTGTVAKGDSRQY